MADDYKFTPPSTYTPPDDKQAGETFDATVQLRVEDDGRLCILTIDGVPLDEGKEEAPDTEEQPAAPTSMAEAARMQREMGTQM